LVGFVLGNDASRAKDVASWALDFGFGPEKLRVDLQPEKFPGLRDARYVMWTIDSEGVATNYTSDQALANVADVAARYEAIARAVDASAVAPFVSEWETSSEPPGQIRLPRANEPGEHLEFDLAVLGRQVPEREVELATDRSGKKAREGNNRWSDPNYIVWEENRDGTAKWRAVEMKLADARERAVKIAVGGRKKHGELSVTCITAWDPRQELPPRTVPATSLAVIGVPVEFDIHKEIHDRFPSRPPAIEPSKEPSDQMYDLHVICVQSTLEVKPGDYLQVREGKHGEPVGYLRGQGFGPDQVAAAPQYAVVRRDNNQVVAARYLEHEAQWAMERYVDADHEFMMGLERHHLPPVPDEQAQVHLPPNGTEQAVEPVRETPGLERSERLDEASLSSATQRRTDPDFER